MERESFEDEDIAQLFNSGYVAIKVDREERPDIDHLYMSVCQALTGHGGWPLTIIMTPDKKPFFAGTYFPKERHGGMPGLTNVLTQVRMAWEKGKDELIRSGEEFTRAILKESGTTKPGELTQDTLVKAYQALEASFDPKYGGFGNAPKFPMPSNILYLLRYYHVVNEAQALEIVEKTLTEMYRGGIFDHIGYGFSRYSTDRKWLAPHFEKMLYDNALLAIAYLETYQITKKSLYREVTERIFAYILRDMTSPEGAFYSAEDADSEGEEGKFYLWTPKEVEEILGWQKGKVYCRQYDITERGNFEGKNIPNLIDRDIPANAEETELLEECRRQLFIAREKRVHPYKDDKILTAWNALMIAALAIGARILGRTDYLVAAERAVNFLIKKLKTVDGRLLARYRDGEAAYPAYADDYAFLVWSLLEMYEAGYKPYYLAEAAELNKKMLELFWDEDNGSFYMTATGDIDLPARPREIYDGAAPAGNSVAALNLLRLAALTGDHALEEKAWRLFSTVGGEVNEHPVGYTYLLQACLFAQSRTREVVIADNGGPEAGKMLEIMRTMYMPHTVTLYLNADKEEIREISPFLKDYHAPEGKSAAYVCENRACRAPVFTACELQKILEEK